MKLTANLEDRTITGLVLPFNEVGRTSLGGVTASPESVIDFDSDMTLNMEHDGTRPAGKIVGLPEETTDGIVATFKVANTTTGTDLLTEVSEGLRTGLSVELDRPVIRAGRLVSGVLTAVAAVTKPAFDSARVLTAADAGELPEDATDEVKAALEKALEIIADNTETPADEATDNTTSTEEDDVTNSLAATVSNDAAPTLNTGNANRDTASAFQAVASTFKRTGSLTAALANVVHDDGDGDGDGLGEIAAQDAWLGEVFRKAPYQRKFIPLVANGVLTTWKKTGFRYTATPTVSAYSGNKAEIPTQGISAEPYEAIAKRWAVGADIDRRFVDFGDTNVVQAWFEFAANSYTKVTDADLAAFLLAQAEEELPGVVPSGISRVAAAIVDGALALIADDLNPTFAVVGSDLFRDYALTPKDKRTEFLSEGAGLTEAQVAGFRVIPSALPAYQSQVVVVDGSTVRYNELNGGLRVEAEHISHGGKDVGLFGYSANEVLEEGGIRLIDLGTGS